MTKRADKIENLRVRVLRISESAQSWYSDRERFGDSMTNDCDIYCGRRSA